MTILCAESGYEGPAFAAHRGYRWYYFLAAFTGVGLVPLAIALIVLGNLRQRVCPRCWSKRFRVNQADSYPTPEQTGLLQAARDKDERQLRRNKLITLGVVLAMLAGSIVFAIVYGAFLTD